nr:8837_t:CDS:2 [Entrophospora candida]
MHLIPSSGFSIRVETPPGGSRYKAIVTLDTAITIELLLKSARIKNGCLFVKILMECNVKLYVTNKNTVLDIRCVPVYGQVLSFDGKNREAIIAV